MNAITMKMLPAFVALMLATAMLSTCLPGWTIDDPLNQPHPKEDDRR